MWGGGGHSLMGGGGGGFIKVRTFIKGGGIY